MNDLLIFLHIPKTAGSSLVKGLSQNFKTEEVLLLYGIKKTSDLISSKIASFDKDKRDSIKLVAGHQVWFGIHNYFPNHRPRYITFLRDPVSRVISNYYKILRNPNHQLYQRFMDNRPTLVKFVNGQVTQVAINHMTVFLGRQKIDTQHNASQCTKFNIDLLDKAINNLREFWFIGLKERYATDITKISKLINKEITEYFINRSVTVQTRRNVPSAEIIRACHENNQMDSNLYHAAAIANELQSPKPLIF